MDSGRARGWGRARPFQRGHGLTRRPAHTSLRHPLFHVTREAGISSLYLHDEVKVPECKPVGPEGLAPVAKPGLEQEFLKCFPGSESEADFQCEDPLFKNGFFISIP